VTPSGRTCIQRRSALTDVVFWTGVRGPRRAATNVPAAEVLDYLSAKGKRVRLMEMKVWHALLIFSFAYVIGRKKGVALLLLVWPLIW
jgi:hypothetical protein